jgi:hypothetical protein
MMSIDFNTITNYYEVIYYQEVSTWTVMKYYEKDTWPVRIRSSRSAEGDGIILNFCPKLL